LSQVLTLFTTPVIYLYLDRLSQRLKPQGAVGPSKGLRQRKRVARATRVAASQHRMSAEARLRPKGRLYSVCRNGVMVVSDPTQGRVIGQAPIGHGADGVAWLDGRA
jgi:hypothetical protein